VQGPVLVENPAYLQGIVLEEAGYPWGPAAEVDRECSVDILVLFVAVSRWDGGFGGELAVFGNLRSIASLRVLEGGLGQLALHLR
jgi:hypothetical protein